MENIIVGSISLLVGCLIVIFYKPLARLTIEIQNKFWGLDFGDAEIKTTRVVCAIVGTGFIIIGILSLLKVIRFK